ncbi:aspartate aminotransferase family protein [Salinarimonas rosea]|uniref:aspartate aminotransferase family protein n=1 Tax=Salinarimonas rosea TaxID=552063 RepID=UPI0003FBD7D3|nr:aspartate aminotransferase family protein [Salinarimonas rosea]
MSATIYKTLASTPIEVVGGEGAWLHGAGGERILDTCGGVCVSSLGHRHPGMIEAMRAAAGDVAWAHAGSFTCAAAEELADFLVARSGGLAKVQFLSGGSEAMELALKVAYQYHCERGEPERSVFVARRQGYHGSTLGTLAISGNRDRRSVFEPLLMRTEFVSPCYAYRGKAPGESDAAYAARLADELDEAMRAIGPGRVAGFLAEPVVGSTNGAVPAVPGYFEAVRRVCDRHGALLILDDVMSGMGRSGPLYSHLEDGIVPDIVAVGKGLAAGYQPISGYLLAGHVFDAIRDGSGVLRNGQTHVNHPFACAVALAAQRIVEEEDLLATAAAHGRRMRALLADAFADHPFVGDVRGRGLFLGIELVADRETREPLDGGGALVAELKRRALARELLIYPGAGTADGVRGNHVLFAPPFVSSPDEIAEMVSRFAETLADVRPVLEAAARAPALA